MTEDGAQYDHIGSKYDEYAQTATMKRAESYTVLRMVGPLAGKRVLDLACGFGFYTRLLKDPRLDRSTTAHMRLFISGSAPLLAQTHREFRERTGHAILERYGLTETGMNTSNPHDGERVPGSVGLPLPGVVALDDRR